MIVKIRLFRSRLNGKPIEHIEVTKTTVNGEFYILHFKNKVIKYPICNIWEIEEQQTKPEVDFKTHKIRIDNDAVMEQDIKTGP